MLSIESIGEQRTISVRPTGILIGQSPACDVILTDTNINAEHARLFQDPFGRWIVESVHSGVAISVNEQEAEAFSIRVGDKIRIGLFLLRLVEVTKPSIVPLVGSETLADIIVDEDESRQILTGENQGRSEISPANWGDLDRITNQLANLTNSRELYPETCKYLANTPGKIALVVKVPPQNVSLKLGLKIISHHTASNNWAISSCSIGDHVPLNIHLSHTVLEAVRKKHTAYAATSESSNDDTERLSLIDDLAPRTVLAAPIAETSHGIDVLYLDMPTTGLPSDTLGFFAVVARMVNLTRQTLLMAEDKAERQVLDHQLSTATKIQSKLMPRNLRLCDNVEVALHYKPARWVGGDYCDLCLASDGRLVFAVGDVTGKGLPAALVMANLQSMLKSILLFNSTPKKILNNINDMLCDTLLDGMFITLLMGFLDVETGELEYVNAGHELPVLMSYSGQVEELGKPVNLPLGITRTDYLVQQHTLRPGDGLLVASDGIIGTFSPESEMFGGERLIGVINEVSTQSCQQIIDSVVASTTQFKGHFPPSDDSTILTLRWKPENIYQK